MHVLFSCCTEGARHASDQVTHTVQTGGRTFTSQQQLKHEEEIKQLLQPPTPLPHTPSDTQQGVVDTRPDAPAVVSSGGGATHQEYPNIRVKPPVGQGKVREDGGEDVSGVVGETHTGGTSGSKGPADVGVEKAGDHTDVGGMGGRRQGQQWNGESSQGRVGPGRGRTEEDKAHVRFDASRHRGIDGQDPSAGTRTGPGPMDGTMRGNMMHNYEPVVDGNHPQATGQWAPASRHRAPDGYRPKAVDQLDSGGYGRGGGFTRHGDVDANKPTDDDNVSSDPADYNYRYYKVHHPGGGDAMSRTPGSGFDKGYAVGGDKGPWRKTGHFTGDSRPVSGPAMDSDRNRAGYYYPRNPDQEGHGDYDSYYDSNGRKGYYSNDDGPGLFLPYKHHDVFDYYAPETGTS